MIYSNKLNLPKSLCRALMGDDYDLNKVDKSLKIYSATGLIKPIRQSELSNRHWEELQQDVSDNLWRMLGSAIHAVLEQSGGEDIIRERRMYLDLDTKEVFFNVADFKDKTHIYIAAKPDIYDISEKTIEDFKITSVWNVVFMNTPGGAKEEWTEQLNIYAYISRKAGTPVDRLRVIAILRDHQRSKTVDFDYPQSPFQVIDIDLWDDAKIEAFIKEKVDLRLAAESQTDDEIPVCTPEERWGSGSKFAVIQKGKKRAIRVFDDKERAQSYLTSILTTTLKESDLCIQERSGGDRKCVSYCNLGILCSYYREVYGGKDNA